MWAYILGAVVILLIAGLIMAAVKGKMTDAILMVGLLALIICSAGSLMFFYQNNVQNNASFSKQLMDEYHATTKRPFTAIQADLFRDHVANDVFTQNGKDTLVAITLVNRDGNKETLEFTALDGSSSYPKPEK
jgi:uncharacterized protein YxeA